MGGGEVWLNASRLAYLFFSEGFLEKESHNIPNV